MVRDESFGIIEAISTFWKAVKQVVVTTETRNGVKTTATAEA